MQSTKTAGFIQARIRNVRLVSEHAEVTNMEQGVTVTLTMSDETLVEARWESSSSGETMLVIAPAVNTRFSDANANVALVTYQSRHEVRFLIDAYTGFDPAQTLPDDAVTPYIEMALFIVKSKASASIRNMGLQNFTWPQNEVQPVSDTGEPPQPSNVKPKSKKKSTQR